MNHSRDLIIYDTETTGLVQPDPVPLKRQPRIIEFAAVRLDWETLTEKDHIIELIDPGVDIADNITQITGIKNHELKGKPPFAKIYPRVCEFFLGARYLVGQNLDFDKKVLSFELMRIGCELAFPWPHIQYCTVEKSFEIKGYRLKLSELYELATNGGKLEGAHRAINDVRATATAFRYLRENGYIEQR